MHNKLNCECINRPFIDQSLSLCVCVCVCVCVHSHSMRLLELADLLDLVHKVSSVYILHDKIQSVLRHKGGEVRKARSVKH